MSEHTVRVREPSTSDGSGPGPARRRPLGSTARRWRRRCRSPGPWLEGIVELGLQVAALLDGEAVLLAGGEGLDDREAVDLGHAAGVDRQVLEDGIDVTRIERAEQTDGVLEIHDLGALGRVLGGELLAGGAGLDADALAGKVGEAGDRGSGGVSPAAGGG
jgi:hypothetical protein